MTPRDVCHPPWIEFPGTLYCHLNLLDLTTYHDFSSFFLNKSFTTSRFAPGELWGYFPCCFSCIFFSSKWTDFTWFPTFLDGLLSFFLNVLRLSVSFVLLTIAYFLLRFCWTPSSIAVCGVYTFKEVWFLFASFIQKYTHIRNAISFGRVHMQAAQHWDKWQCFVETIVGDPSFIKSRFEWNFDHASWVSFVNMNSSKYISIHRVLWQMVLDVSLHSFANCMLQFARSF